MRVYAEMMGFSAENTGSENSKILNGILRKYDEVAVFEKVTYKIAETIEIRSNQGLLFAEDVLLKREKSEQEQILMQ